MEIGVGLPVAGRDASPDAIAQVAERADKLGYAAVWTFERVVRPVAEMPAWDGKKRPLPEIYKTVYDSLDALSFVAARTKKVKLGTSIVDALFQSPPQLGKRFATLDQLSGGRVIAGLGQGAIEAEFVATETPMKRRGAGFEEYLAALHAVWGPDPVSFKGRFYQIPESNINPKPVQRHVPLILGTASEAGVERAARLADGINPVLFAWEPVAATIKSFHDKARAAGRDPHKLQVVARINSAPGAHTGPLTGTLEEIKEELARAKQIGITHVFWDMSWANVPIAAQLEWMDKLRQLFD